MRYSEMVCGLPEATDGSGRELAAEEVAACLGLGSPVDVAGTAVIVAPLGKGYIRLALGSSRATKDGEVPVAATIILPAEIPEPQADVAGLRGRLGLSIAGLGAAVGRIANPGGEPVSKSQVASWIDGSRPVPARYRPAIRKLDADTRRHGAVNRSGEGS